jgi:hypothetical protein
MMYAPWRLKRLTQNTGSVARRGAREPARFCTRRHDRAALANGCEMLLSDAAIRKKPDRHVRYIRAARAQNAQKRFDPSVGSRGLDKTPLEADCRDPGRPNHIAKWRDYCRTSGRLQPAGLITSQSFQRLAGPFCRSWAGITATSGRQLFSHNDDAHSHRNQRRGD